MSTKESLAWRARAGDTEAFAALYEEVYRDLYRMALYTLKNPQDAEDVVSDTVADAFASIRKLRDADAFRAWIFKILSNKCRRKMKEYVHRTEELPEEMGRRQQGAGGRSGGPVSFFLPFPIRTG